MIGRCTNPDHSSFMRYGGRGISICEPWLLFVNFLSDMGERPIGTTLDRIDNGGHYEPRNCRWATPKQQARNKRNSKLFTLDGVTATLAEWTELLGVNACTIPWRLAQGWSIRKALTKPPRKV